MLSYQCPTTVAQSKHKNANRTPLERLLRVNGGGGTTCDVDITFPRSCKKTPTEPLWNAFYGGGVKLYAPV